MPAQIRLAAESDAAAMVDIYAPVVRDTVISFELVPPTVDEFRARVRDISAFAPFLVYEQDGRVVGYAYASKFRARAAYRFTVETTVYVHADFRGRGVGRALYDALLRCLRLQGFRRAIGGITLPNAASVGLHEATGFTKCAVFAKVGFKFGAWHDVGFWELELAPHVADPTEPRAIDELAATEEFRSALRVVPDERREAR
jgi:phosphinothricin acetyltransferase